MPDPTVPPGASGDSGGEPTGAAADARTGADGDLPEGPDARTGAEGDVPEAAGRRLGHGAFSSGLSIPDLAGCLQLGLQPVGFVQGFCVMQWGWSGAGYGPRTGPWRSGWSGYVSDYRCPHVMVSAEHRAWGQNYEQPWVEDAWASGFGAAYGRMVEEAEAAGAHGVIGVADRARPLGDLGATEFHVTGTAVTLTGVGARTGPVWTTSLAGQRLVKLVEAGFMPVAFVAALASVRVWASCVTQYLLQGSTAMWGAASPAEEVQQLSEAHMAVRRLVRDRVRHQLGGDALHGASLVMSSREGGEGDQVMESTLRGNRVRRFADYAPVDPPLPTVRLS